MLDFLLQVLPVPVGYGGYGLGGLWIVILLLVILLLYAVGSAVAVFILRAQGIRNRPLLLFLGGSSIVAVGLLYFGLVRNAARPLIDDTQLVVMFTVIFAVTMPIMFFILRRRGEPDIGLLTGILATVILGAALTALATAFGFRLVLG